MFPVNMLIDKGISISADNGGVVYLNAIPGLYFDVSSITIDVHITNGSYDVGYYSYDAKYLLDMVKYKLSEYRTEEGFTFSVNRTELMFLLNHTFVEINLVDSNLSPALNHNVSLMNLINQMDTWKSSTLNLTNTDILGRVELHLDVNNVSVYGINALHLKDTIGGIDLYLGMHRLRTQQEVTSLIVPAIGVYVMVDIVFVLVTYYLYTEYKKEEEYRRYKAKIFPRSSD